MAKQLFTITTNADEVVAQMRADLGELIRQRVSEHSAVMVSNPNAGAPRQSPSGGVPTTEMQKLREFRRMQVETLAKLRKVARAEATLGDFPQLQAIGTAGVGATKRQRLKARYGQVAVDLVDEYEGGVGGNVVDAILNICALSAAWYYHRWTEKPTTGDDRAWAAIESLRTQELIEAIDERLRELERSDGR